MKKERIYFQTKAQVVEALRDGIEVRVALTSIYDTFGKYSVPLYGFDGIHAITSKPHESISRFRNVVNSDGTFRKPVFCTL